MKPRVEPTGPFSSQFLEACGVCDEACHPVAKDTSVGTYVCGACIGSVLTVESFLVRNSVFAGLRHPHPKEFNEENNN
jgi:hypothetical protein